MKKILSYILLFFSFESSIAQTPGQFKTEYREYISRTSEVFRYCYVWDTKTGNAIRYHYLNSNIWEKGKSTLPSNPLNVSGNEIGEVMLSTTEYYDSKSNITRVVYYYNTKTGKVVRYYFSETGKWEKSTSELENPISSSMKKVGEISMNAIEYYNAQDTQFRSLFFCNTITGETARYYFNHEQKKWIKSDVALPENPTN